MSPRASGTFSHEQWAADLDGLREWAGAETVAMAGGSYGGFMAMEYAIRYPDRVSALVLRDTSPDNGNAHLARENAMSSDRVTRRHGRSSTGSTAARSATTRTCGTAGARSCRSTTSSTTRPRSSARSRPRPYRYEAHNYAFAVNLPGYDLKPLLPQITAPTLVTVGRTDWITPVSCSETIVELVPDARLAVFEKSGHSPQIEEAEAWTATVRAFLHEVYPPNRPAGGGH